MESEEKVFPPPPPPCSSSDLQQQQQPSLFQGCTLCPLHCCSKTAASHGPMRLELPKQTGLYGQIGHLKTQIHNLKQLNITERETLMKQIQGLELKHSLALEKTVELTSKNRWLENRVKFMSDALSTRAPQFKPKRFSGDRRQGGITISPSSSLLSSSIPTAKHAHSPLRRTKSQETVSSRLKWPTSWTSKTENQSETAQHCLKQQQQQQQQQQPLCNSGLYESIGNLAMTNSQMAPIQEVDEDGDWVKEKDHLLLNNRRLSFQVRQLEGLKKSLEVDLQEARDQLELLEFRVLELEQGVTTFKESGEDKQVVDQNISIDLTTATEKFVEKATDHNNGWPPLLVTEDLLVVQKQQGSNKPSFREEKLSEIQSKVLDIVRHRSSLNVSDKTTLVQTLAILDICQKVILESRTEPLEKTDAEKQLSNSEIRSLKSRLRELELENEELGRRRSHLSPECSSPTESNQDFNLSGFPPHSTTQTANASVDVLQLVEKMESLTLDVSTVEELTDDSGNGNVCDRLYRVDDVKCSNDVCVRATHNNLATELSELGIGQKVIVNNALLNNSQFGHDDIQNVTNDELQRLTHLLATKQTEMKNKEAEYSLKLEALKYDREEVVNRLEGRLNIIQQRELQCRKELDVLVTERERWKEQYNVRASEFELEKEALVKQLLVCRTENERLEKALRQTENENHGQWTCSTTDIDSDLTAKLEEFKRQDGRHRQRIRHLEGRWEALKREVCMGQTHVGDEDRGSDDEAEELLARIGEVFGGEAVLRKRIGQLEKKEAAYKETLDEADRIVADVETNYQERLDEMKQTERRLRQKIIHLEQNEAQLRQAPTGNSATRAELKKVGELLEQLMEAEAAENRLRERLREAERREEEAKQRLSEVEKEIRETVARESQEKEEFVGNLENLKRTERSQQLRIEELEASEEALRETLRKADEILESRERDLKEIIRELQAQLNQAKTMANTKTGQFSHDEMKKMTDELQNLSSWEAGFESLKEQLKDISGSVSACTRCQPNLGPALGHLETQMKQLHEIVFGGQTSLDSLAHHSDFPDHGPHVSGTDIVERKGEKYVDDLVKSNEKSQNPNNTLLPLPDQTFFEKRNDNYTNYEERTTDGSQSVVINELKSKLDSLMAQLAHREQEMWAMDQEASMIQIQLGERDRELEDKGTEMSSLSLQVSHLHEENEDLRRKLWKVEVAHKVATEKASQKSSEAESAKRRISDLETKVVALNKQLRSYEQIHKEREQMQERLNLIENELKKKREIEHRLCAENLHLHHKVEGLRERVSSLQLLKRDHKSLLTKHSALEKKLAAAELAVGPLNNQIASLRRECWDKERIIERLNAEHCKSKLSPDESLIVLEHRKLVLQSSSQSSDDSGIKDCSETITSRESETSEDSVLTDISVLSEDLNTLRACSPTGSCVSSSGQSQQDGQDKELSISPVAKSRIPRYTALKSPTYAHSNSDAGSIKGSLSRTSSQSSIMSFGGGRNLQSEHQKSSNKTQNRIRRARYNSTSSSDGSFISEKSSSNSSDSKIGNCKNASKCKSNTTAVTVVRSKTMSKGKVQPNTPKQANSSANGIPDAPTNFQVTRKVGQDGLLVAWNVPSMDNSGCSNNATVSGYQIFVNGKLHQKVRSAHRTKALLNNLDFNECLPIQIAIETLALTGQHSKAVLARYDGNDSLLPPPKVPLSKCLYDSGANHRLSSDKKQQDKPCVYPSSYSPLARLVEV